METTDGSISFSDAEAGDTHTASFQSQASGYVGTFSLDPVSEVPGNGSVAWHYTVDNADIQFLAQGQTLVQTYAVTILDSNGASTVQDVSIAINGVNEAPTAVSETVVTDVGTGGTIDIPGWALASNDQSRLHRSRGARQRDVESAAAPAPVSAMRSSPMTPCSAARSTTRPPTASRHRPTLPPRRSPTMPTSATTLTAAGGDSILIATQGSEQLVGGAGNDVLIGTASGNLMTGGGGNDTFAFLQVPPTPGQITDFNNTSQHDRIAISANGFGGGLTAGMDVTSTYETLRPTISSRAAAEFHFDTGEPDALFQRGRHAGRRALRSWSRPGGSGGQRARYPGRVRPQDIGFARYARAPQGARAFLPAGCACNQSHSKVITRATPGRLNRPAFARTMQVAFGFRELPIRTRI